MSRPLVFDLNQAEFSLADSHYLSGNLHELVAPRAADPAAADAPSGDAMVL